MKNIVVSVYQQKVGELYYEKENNIYGFNYSNTKLKLYILFIILLANTLLANNQSNIFTKEEFNYLKNKKEIRMCSISTLEPFEQIVDGKHKGVVADIMALFAQQLPIPLKLIEAKSYPQIIQFIKDNKCDIKPVVLKEFSIFNKFDITTPYLQNYLVVITKTNTPFAENIKYIKNKKFAVQYPSFKKYLKKQFPYIKDIVVLNSQEEILKELKKDTIYGYINLALASNHTVQKYGFKDLKVNTRIKGELHASIGVMKEDKLLLSIFNKIIKNSSTQEMENLKSKIRVESYEKKVDYTLVYNITILFLIILSIVLFFLFKQIRLKKEIQKQSLLLINQSNNAAIGRLMSIIAHQWRQPLSLINSITSNIYHNTLNKEVLKIEDVTSDLSQSISNINKFYANDNNKKAQYMKEIIQECIDILFPTIAFSLKPKIVINEVDKLQLDGYSTGFQQIFITLLSNSVSIFEQRNIKSPTITITFYNQNKFHCIDIEDNGGGISKDNIDKIFDTNFSTNNQQENLRGYGLSIAKDIVENNLKGTIKVLNTKDGAKFMIRYK